MVNNLGERFYAEPKEEGKIWYSVGLPIRKYVCTRRPMDMKHGRGELWWKREGASSGGVWIKDVGIWK